MIVSGHKHVTTCCLRGNDMCTVDNVLVVVRTNSFGYGVAHAHHKLIAPGIACGRAAANLAMNVHQGCPVVSMFVFRTVFQASVTGY